MDNSVHYVSYDPDAIWEEMLTNYRSAGGETLYAGDAKEILLRAVMADIVQVLAGVDNALRMQTLRYATGEYLDLLGEARGCPRLPAAAASVTLRIVTNATGQASTLAAGTSFTADGTLFFRLTADLSLSGGAQTLSAEAQADRPGEAGNALLAGTVLQPERTNAALQRVSALTDAHGGVAAEDDENYRERIRSYALTRSCAGPAAQYEALALAVSGEIEDAHAVQIDDGCVGVFLILRDGADSETLIPAVEAALSADDVRPLTDRVSVDLATELSYTLILEYAVDSADSSRSGAIAAAINEAAASWQEWQDGHVGRAFNPDRLLAAAYQAGASRVVWGEGSSFDGGFIAYTEIDETERCKGSVTVTPMES